MKPEISKFSTPVEMSRRTFLQNTMWMSAAISTGVGSWVIPAHWANAAGPIKVGVATDFTGPIGFAGRANAIIGE